MYYAVGTMIIAYDYNKVKKKKTELFTVRRVVYSQTSTVYSLTFEVIDKIPLHIPLD